MHDILVVQEMLRIILPNDRLFVDDTEFRFTFPSKYSSWMDVLCRTGENQICSIKIQKVIDRDDLKNAMLNASLLEMIQRGNGAEEGNVKTSHIVYLAESDLLGDGRTVYHIGNVIRETKESLGGIEQIFVNAEVDDGSLVADLMKCFFQTEGFDLDFPELSTCMRWAKETEEGRRTLESSMKKYYPDI